MVRLSPIIACRKSTANRVSLSCNRDTQQNSGRPRETGAFSFFSNECRKTLRRLPANVARSMSDPVSPESHQEPAHAASISPEVFQSKLSELMNQHFGEDAGFGGA